MKKIKKLSIPNDARVIVISDIHGELNLLKEALHKVNFKDEDYLIINGDLCEKGRDSVGVVNYVMNLVRNTSNVHVVEGNCEVLVDALLNENPGLINYLCTRKHSIFNEWLEQLDFSVHEGTSIREVKEALLSEFSQELYWLTELPTAIETEDYIFVHAGLEDRVDWKETERKNAIAMPEFFYKSHKANKYVIVGHWPVVNYSEEAPSNNPVIDKEKKIIAIDGGNAIKEAGQLNAFIIQRKQTGDTFSYTYVDYFPQYEVIADFNANSEMQGGVTYPYYYIEPIEKMQDYTVCKQKETNNLLTVKNEYMKQLESGEYTVKTDISCAQISVRKGDLVSLIDDSCSGYDLIKKDGVEGWIEKGILIEVNKKGNNILS
ncbi:metallophosphoesterase [Bacillus thuringiensis]|uniref:Serine/threonine protein phosphatase n=1 Tax=Bacillus thuringiensis serovar toumanoffi TaxID=180862 RepID=A0ABD5HYN2_BACTU|nr:MULTISPECIES: metallophosphoesterase [Bacillus]KXY57291.1 serine/threonine protein phosphatase [Bacillus cereus]KAB2371684.1 serine/threonine protein phosphatase [Bacillus sp. RM2(2019)]MCR6780041.1 metallophosphoesterase [Bacillus thuringiensis]MCR6858110.1 metallophosphoesterase [Bacillus thuringiensis]MCR6866671.1 metallophosphoesterase [Bacillus thuringiensis]